MKVLFTKHLIDIALLISTHLNSSNLNSLISLNRIRSTRSSSRVTLNRPSNHSHLFNREPTMST